MRLLPLLFLTLCILGSRLSAQDETAPTNPPPKLEPWQIAGMRAAFGDSRVPYAESSWDVQREALKICAELGWGSALDAHEISGYLSSLDEAAQRASVKALGQCGKEASFSMKDLVALLAKDAPAMAEEASNALCQMAAAGAPAADEVEVLLESDNATVRARGAATLGSMGHAFAAQLAPLVEDQDQFVRLVTVSALAKIKDG
ncbi:MAG TPA: hypothetical protein VGH90_05700, partial [Chthoniobacteraceae bacterium]